MRFDVNDALLRRDLLGRVLPAALADLRADARPAWGNLSARQMVEHLVWSVEVSLGEVRVECALSGGRLERARAFLSSDLPTPHGFENPALAAGLPPLRWPTLEAAREALLAGLARFHAARGDGKTHVHPVFGALDHEHWERAHFKHVCHHLLQFGLLQVQA